MLKIPLIQLFTFSYEMAYQCHDEAEHDERTRSEHEDQDIIVGRNDSPAAERAGAQKLTHGSNQRQSDSEADTHSKSIQHTVNDGILAGECLRTSQHDAVDDNQQIGRAHV